MYGSVIRVSANFGIGSSLRRSYNFRALSRVNESYDVAMTVSGSGQKWAGGCTMLLVR